MRSRSLGVTTLALGTGAVGLYCQLAGLGLLLTGSIFRVTGSAPAFAALVVSTGFFVVSMIAYGVAYGFWTRRRWSWAVGIFVYGALVGASVVLVFLSTNAMSAVLPTLSAALAVWYLQRPATRAELLGRPILTQATVAVTEKLEVAKSAH